MRLSPQDIDRLENEQMDEDGWLSGPSLFSQGTQWQVFACLDEKKLSGTQRTVVHHRHGRMPGLDDLERTM